MTDGLPVRFRSQPHPLHRLVKMMVHQAFTWRDGQTRPLLPQGGAHNWDATLSSSSHSWQEVGEGRTKGRAEAPPALVAAVLLAAVLLWSEVVSGPENVQHETCAAAECGDSLGRRQQGERSEMDFLWPPDSICLETPPHKKLRLTYSSVTFDGWSVEIKGAALQPLGGFGIMTGWRQRQDGRRCTLLTGGRTIAVRGK